jgi:cytochrome c biogenesis protein CcdA
VEDLLLAFLEPLFELLVDVLLQLVFELFLSFLWRKARAARWKSRRISLWLILPFLGVLGAAVGWISILIIPAPIFHPGRVHGLSLIISPLLTGLSMALIGSNLRRRKEMPAPLESFSGGFAFALGMALVRFLHAGIGI